MLDFLKQKIKKQLKRVYAANCKQEQSLLTKKTS